MEAITCPITHCVPNDPVVAYDGHTYDREAIQMWFNVRDTSPVTQRRIPTLLLPNFAACRILHKPIGIHTSGLLEELQTFALNTEELQGISVPSESLYLYNAGDEGMSISDEMTIVSVRSDYVLLRQTRSNVHSFAIIENPVPRFKVRGMQDLLAMTDFMVNTSHNCGFVVPVRVGSDLRVTETCQVFLPRPFTTICDRHPAMQALLMKDISAPGTMRDIHSWAGELKSVSGVLEKMAGSKAEIDAQTLVKAMNCDLEYHIMLLKTCDQWLAQYRRIMLTSETVTGEAYLEWNIKTQNGRYCVDTGEPPPIWKWVSH
jgi:hypothetical protein